MNNSIKKLLREDITIYHFDKLVEGDSTFHEPVVVKGAAVPKTTRIYDRDGEIVTTNTSIYIDGIYFESLDGRDEISTRFTGRVPIQKILPYPNLKGDVEIIELLI